MLFAAFGCIRGVFPHVSGRERRTKAAKHRRAGFDEPLSDFVENPELTGSESAAFLEVTPYVIGKALLSDGLATSRAF